MIGRALCAMMTLVLAIGSGRAASQTDDKSYRIDWTKGSITQIACDNGAYFTLRWSETRKLYFVQELVDVAEKELDKAASRACSAG